MIAHSGAAPAGPTPPAPPDPRLQEGIITMADLPRDRFDEIPATLGRVGAHRAPRSPRGVWISVAWAALASGLLVVLGLYLLSLITDRVTFDLPGLGTAQPTPTPSETVSAPPTVDPITDPALAEVPAGFTITVLNGTELEGLGSTARDLIAAPGWPVGTVTAAAQSDIAETVVFFSDPALEGVAAGMAELLGVGTAEQSDAFPGAPITIVLGADFAEVSGG